MASTFPGAIDSFTDPLSNSPLNSPSHSTLHSDINDAVEKVETYMGLVKVIPTSVAGSGVSVSATGTVTIASATSASINGCFTSRFTNYRVLIENLTGSASVSTTMRLRAAGVDSSTQYYSGNFYSTWGGGASGAYGENNGSGWAWCFSYLTSCAWQFEILRPNVAATTSYSFLGHAPDTGRFGSGLHNVATAYDGFTIFPASGTISATIRVYGYAD